MEVSAGFLVGWPRAGSALSKVWGRTPRQICRYFDLFYRPKIRSGNVRKSYIH